MHTHITFESEKKQKQIKPKMIYAAIQRIGFSKTENITKPWLL